MLKLLKCRFSISSVEMNECLHFFQPPLCCLLFAYFMLGLINICFLNNCYACVHIKGSMACTGDHLMCASVLFDVRRCGEKVRCMAS